MATEKGKVGKMDMHNTSKTLLQRLQHDGDEESWRRFASEYRPFIMALINRFSVSLQDSEELAQDVLVTVWQALPDFLYLKNRCRFRTWLAKVTRNKTLNFLNSARSKREKLNEPVNNEVLHLSYSSELDEREEREWQLFLTRKAWENIQPLFKPKHLKVYSLMLKGKSAAEAAAELGIEENTAYRYRKQVQKAMNHELNSLKSEMDG